MIIVHDDGALTLRGSDGLGLDHATIDLSADMVMQQNNVIERVLDFALDVLKLRNVELRVREHAVIADAPRDTSCCTLVNS